MDVREKAVIIAGGAGSLGSVIASDLQARGARVIVVDARVPSNLPDGIESFVADLSDDDAVAETVRSIAGAVGKISALVNCAGLIHSEPLVNLMSSGERTHRMSTWDATIRSNLTATFLTGARVAEHMAASRVKGVIVNFSSVAAQGNPGQSAYAAAKAGIEAMTAVWSRELGPYGIRAVAIAPGFIGTPSTHEALSESIISDLKRRTPLMRLGKPEEIASAVRFALENDFLTGTTIALDGGIVL